MGKKRQTFGSVTLDKKNTIVINKLSFQQLSLDESLEQYNVFKGKSQVAYVHLRYGILSVLTPDALGEIIYSKDYNIEFKGCFKDNEERMRELNIIANKIVKFISGR